MPSCVNSPAAWVAIFFASSPIFAADTLRLDPTKDLDLKGVRAETAEYRGHRALKLTETPQSGPADVRGVAILKTVKLRNGTIELEVAGAPAQAAIEGARGFIGVAFRTSPDATRFEQIYLRPTNGRAEDQVRRNHSVQYASSPDYPWPRLRKEEPEKYETHVDLEPGVWTKMKIVIEGRRARLYVHGGTQPTLIVNDLKLGESEGGVALWIGPGTEGYFRDVRVTP